MAAEGVTGRGRLTADAPNANTEQKKKERNCEGGEGVGDGNHGYTASHL